MAFWDAVVRTLVGLILIWLGIEKGGVFIIAEVVGFVLLFTAITTFCPLYLISGIRTKGEDTA